MVNLSGGELTDAQREKLRMLGIDPGPAAAAPAAPAREADDEDATLAQLERLAALRAQGVRSEEEFAAQKARILGAG